MDITEYLASSHEILCLAFAWPLLLCVTACLLVYQL